MSDILQRFLFEAAPVRGEWVCLEETWSTVQTRGAYPQLVEKVLGEFCAAAVLLGATLKYDGRMIMQIQGDGPVSLMVVEYTSDSTLRATAKYKEPFAASSFNDLFGNGNLVITIEPKQTGERYQGIVKLDGGSVAKVLEGYLTQSEQLPTRLYLAANEKHACGLLLQRMPGHDDEETEIAYEHVTTLADTLKDDELLTLDAVTLLNRLYHSDPLRLFDPRSVHFQCSCSRERVANALRMMGEAEVRKMVEELGKIESRCEFCNAKYDFDAVDAELLFQPKTPEAGETRH